ncbi:MAG: rod shape-determining protein [Ruminococcaceae bacterium]|nr:rod shape-determining protein [Oscillospiraceae bacterium]
MPTFSKNYIGIDLGTANTLVCTPEKGIIIREPSYVAYDIRTEEIIAIGSGAKNLVGKTPNNISVVRPLRDGVISDFELTLAMLSYFVRQAMNKLLFARPKVVVCIPYGVSQVEHSALENALFEVGVSSVALVEEPVAAAIGAGLAFKNPVGNMIVDIGGGTTEVAVVTAGGVAVSKSLRVAGDELNEAIVEYIRKKFNVVVGEITAEDIKKEIGSAHKSSDVGMLEVRGRNLITGLPSVFNIYSSEIRVAMKPVLNQIVEVIKSTLEITPPELCADIHTGGITISGGGALLSGMSTLISENTKLEVYIARRPLDCVIDGIHKIMTKEGYESVLSVANHKK